MSLINNLLSKQREENRKQSSSDYFFSLQEQYKELYYKKHGVRADSFINSLSAVQMEDFILEEQSDD